MKKTIFIFLMFVSAALTGCQNWLDINDNPNYISDADKDLLLPTVMLVTADKVGYEMTLVGYFWSQYVVQNKNTNQYTTVMDYNLNTQSSYFTSPWSYIYVRVLPSIRTILSECDEESNVSNYVLEAKTMLVYNLYLLTSLYDQVAYTDGYLSEETNTTPSFDTGEQMQEIIIGLLEEIRSMDTAQLASDEKLNSTSAVDMVFGGEQDPMSQWMKFANTLYLRMLLRDFDANQSKIVSLLAENNLLDTADAAFDNFSDSADKSNPLYESDRRQLNTTENIRCCSDITKVLSLTDPRLSYYYNDDKNNDEEEDEDADTDADVSESESEGEGEDAGSSVSSNFLGVPYGQQPTPSEANALRLAATDPVYFATIDEAYFLKAEAYARLGDAANAKTNYEAAIRAAFERCNCDGADSFIEGDYAFQSGTSEEMVEQIINHKWASNVRCMPIESWFDINRTGYPERGKTITSYTGVLDGYPYRFLYPYTSTDYNPNAPTVETLDTKMWWHK